MRVTRDVTHWSSTSDRAIYVSKLQNKSHQRSPKDSISTPMEVNLSITDQKFIIKSNLWLSLNYLDLTGFWGFGVLGFWVHGVLEP